MVSPSPLLSSFSRMAIRGIPVLLPVICLIVISVCSNLFVSSNPVETDDQPAFQSARPTTSTAPSATNNNYNPFSRISNYFNQWRDTRARFQQEQRLTSFFRVCVEGSIDKIDRLISPSRRHAPIDINMVDDSTGNQFTCLIKAALNHEHEMVEYLLSRGGK